MNNKGQGTELLIAFSIMFGLMAVMVGTKVYVQEQRAEIEAALYNQKYGTNYTTHDFFWSGDTIKTFLNGGTQTTQNINIKGAMPVQVIKGEVNE